jgi:membrane protein implicated in regulation of membrane protease activity
MPAWVAWAIVSVLLAIGEIFTPGLFFLGPIAVAAVAATVAAAVGGRSGCRSPSSEPARSRR